MFMAAYMATPPSAPIAATSAVIAQNVRGYSDTAGTSQRETSSITLGGGANRALLAVILGGKNGNTDDVTGTQVTFGAPGRAIGTGTAMTKIAEIGTSSSDRRPFAIIAAVAAPSGSGTVQTWLKRADDVPQPTGSGIVELIELTGADQDLANWVSATDTSNMQGVTARAITLNAVIGGPIISGVALLSGDHTSQFAATGGGTIARTGNTGTSGFSDISTALLTEIAAATGADGHGVTWATSTDAAMAGVFVPGA